jgi:hypothetical protein
MALNRDLAALAALGMLGFALRGKDKKQEKGGEATPASTTAPQSSPDIIDDTYDPNVRYGSVMDLQEPGWESKTAPARTPSTAARSVAPRATPAPIRDTGDETERLARRYPAPSSVRDTGDETARLAKRYPAPTPASVRDTGDETQRLLKRYPAPPTPIRDTGDETARLAKRYPPRSSADLIPGQNVKAPVGGERVSGSELGRNVKNTLMAAGPGRLAGVGNIATEMATAKRVQDAYNRAAAARREAEGFSPAEAIARRNLMDEAAAAGGMKRGGKVKAKPVKKMASGGMARSSASKRADGIATKGKTRGKIY